MAGIKRRLGSLMGPAGYNATGAVDDISTLAQYTRAEAGVNAFNDALTDVTTRVSRRVVPQLLADHPTLTEAAVDAAAIAVQDAGVVTWTPGKNLYDYTQDTLDFYVNWAGATSDLLLPFDGYRASDFIPVVAGQPYTVNVLRHYALYDTTRAFVSGQQLTQGVHTVTPTVDGYLRFSYPETHHTLPPVDPKTVQVEKGQEATAVVPFARILKGVTIEGADQWQPPEAPLSVAKTGEVLSITADHDGTPLVISATLAGRANRIFNVTDTRLAGTVVHQTDDDVAPIRTQHATVGANHGFPMIAAFPAGAHDKTTEDLGSIWNSGGRELVLLSVDAAGVAYFGGDYTIDDNGVDHSDPVSLPGPIVHVSGATHTADVDRTLRISGQMYPSVRNVRQAVFIDGKPLVDGFAEGQIVEVRESYEVLHYGSLYDAAKANPGTHYANLDIAGCVRVESVYRFAGGGVASVTVNLTEMQPTILNVIGLVQSGPMAGDVTRYVPGVKTIDGRNWSAGVNLDDHTATQIVTTTDLHDPSVPPVMSLDVRSDVAFMLGVHPWKAGVTQAAERVVTTPGHLWDLRSGGKSYPTVLSQESAGWGRYEGHAVRAYLTPDQAMQVVSAGHDALGAWAALETVVQLP